MTTSAQPGCRSSTRTAGWSGRLPPQTSSGAIALVLLASLRRMNVEGGAHGFDRVLIEDRSPLAGLTLRSVGLPMSIIVTTIQRHRDLVVPDGTTVLEGGDELVLIGTTGDIETTRRLASAAQPFSEPAGGTESDLTVHTKPER